MCIINAYYLPARKKLRVKYWGLARSLAKSIPWIRLAVDPDRVASNFTPSFLPFFSPADNQYTVVQMSANESDNEND